MEITKREVLFSAIILVVMLILGFFINSAIEESHTKRNEVYYLSTQIEDKDQFQYGLKTSIGNALTYGEISAASPVSMDEISGEYFYIKKVTERYNKHTKIETYRVNGKTRTRTRTYYSWDYAYSNTLASEEFNFMGMTFSNSISGLPYERADLSKIAIDQSKVNSNYIYPDKDFFANVGDIQEYYEIVPLSFCGTIETKLMNNELKNFSDGQKLTLHYNRNISETIEDIENYGKTGIIIFRIVWGILTILAIFVFYYFENRWLED